MSIRKNDFVSAYKMEQEREGLRADQAAKEQRKDGDYEWCTEGVG